METRWQGVKLYWRHAYKFGRFLQICQCASVSIILNTSGSTRNVWTNHKIKIYKLVNPFWRLQEASIFFVFKFSNPSKTKNGRKKIEGALKLFKIRSFSSPDLSMQMQAKKDPISFGAPVPLNEVMLPWCPFPVSRHFTNYFDYFICSLLHFLSVTKFFHVSVPLLVHSLNVK